MQDRCSKFSPSPRQPSDMLRSMLLCAEWGVTSYTEWAPLLKTVPLLAVVFGFDPANVPIVGTFYDFIDRLWMSELDNFSDAVRPPRERPKQPKRKGEKAPSVEKKPVEDVIAAYRAEPSTALAPCSLPQQVFAAGCFAPQTEHVCEDAKNRPTRMNVLPSRRHLYSS